MINLLTKLLNWCPDPNSSLPEWQQYQNYENLKASQQLLSPVSVFAIIFVVIGITILIVSILRHKKYDTR